MKKVHFKGDGGDFMIFDLDKHGHVVEVQPTQYRAWLGTKVFNHKGLVVGESAYMSFEAPKGTFCNSQISMKIERIEEDEYNL